MMTSSGPAAPQSTVSDIGREKSSSKHSRSSVSHQRHPTISSDTVSQPPTASESGEPKSEPTDDYYHPPPVQMSDDEEEEEQQLQRQIPPDLRQTKEFKELLQLKKLKRTTAVSSNERTVELQERMVHVGFRVSRR